MRTKQQLIDEFSDYVEKKDREVRDLQRQLEEARKPRSRMLLVGGPQDGDTVLYAPHPADRYYRVLLPKTRSASVYDPMRPTLFVETAYYRMERVRTGDGDRLIGIFERTA